jgi:hypothetical protein
MPILQLHILWTCGETETERTRTNLTNEVWKGGRKEMEQLITQVKKIQNCIMASRKAEWRRKRKEKHKN